MLEYLVRSGVGPVSGILHDPRPRILEPFVCCIHESTNVQEMLLLFDAVNDSCKSGEMEVE